MRGTYLGAAGVGASHLACSLHSYAIGQEVIACTSRCESRSLCRREFTAGGDNSTTTHNTPSNVQHGGFLRFHYSSSPPAPLPPLPLCPPCPPHPRFWAKSPLTIRRRISKSNHCSFQVREVLGILLPPPNRTEFDTYIHTYNP